MPLSDEQTGSSIHETPEEASAPVFLYLLLPGGDLEFGNVGEPFLIRSGCTEITIVEIFRRWANFSTSCYPS